jgi:hypothetical protein
MSLQTVKQAVCSLVRLLPAPVLGACLVLGACQTPPPAADAVAPPGNLGLGNQAQAGMAAAPMAPGFDGNYSGEMYLVENPGGSCEGRVAVNGMTVRNNVVRFGQFSPRSIGPDGAVQMVDGRIWITGAFDGRQFRGNVQMGTPGCSYQMVLNRS